MNRQPPVVPGAVGREPCDARCPATALVYIQHEGAELALCGHCFDTRWTDLFMGGWQVREDLRTRLREQESNR